MPAVDSPVAGGLQPNELTELLCALVEDPGAIGIDICIFDPDLVLVDRMLPGMDGLETARQMKSQCPRAKLLLMTADPDPALNTASIAAGLEGAIPKSQIDSARLLELLAT